MTSRTRLSGSWSSACWTRLEPMNPAPPVMRSVGMCPSDRCALRILQREPQLLRERIDRGPAALPRAFGLEPQVADAAAPRRDHAADGAEVGTIGVLLVETADDVRGDAHERAKRSRGLDAVLAPAPRRVEDERDLLEVIDEELLGVLVEIGGLAAGPERLDGEQLLQFLRERRLGDA